MRSVMIGGSRLERLILSRWPVGCASRRKRSLQELKFAFSSPLGEVLQSEHAAPAICVVARAASGLSVVTEATTLQSSLRPSRMFDSASVAELAERDHHGFSIRMTSDPSCVSVMSCSCSFGLSKARFIRSVKAAVLGSFMKIQ